MRRTTALLGMTAVLLVNGCGSSARRATANGAVVFADNCSSCHSVIGNESRHTPGGDLLGYTFNRSVLLQYASEMPTPHRLTRAQLHAVADYVLRAQGRVPRAR